METHFVPLICGHVYVLKIERVAVPFLKIGERVPKALVLTNDQLCDANGYVYHKISTKWLYISKIKF